MKKKSTKTEFAYKKNKDKLYGKTKLNNKDDYTISESLNVKDNQELKDEVLKSKMTFKGKKKIILAILIVTVVYAIVMVFKIANNPANTFLVENGTLYLEESLTGYIIRDETVIEGDNYKNGIVPIKAEGEKVAKDDPIFRYYSKNEEKTKKKIEELDEEIQQAMNNETTLFNSDIKLLDTQIETKLDELYKINDIQKIKEYKAEINNYITKKARIAGELSPSGSYIKKLITERSEYEKELNSNCEYVNASLSGIVSYKVDGYESVLSPKDFSKLSKKFLGNLNAKTSQVVASSNEKGKIINNYECYIACVTNSKMAKKAQKGDDVKIRLPNGKEINATIECVNQNEEENVIVVKIERYVEELASYRKIVCDLIWWSASGLKVPNSALLYDGDIAYIVRERVGQLEKIFVKVKKQNDKYAIVSNYSSEELEEKGFDMTKLSFKNSINLYDQILVNVKEEKLRELK